MHKSIEIFVGRAAHPQRSGTMQLNQAVSAVLLFLAVTFAGTETVMARSDVAAGVKQIVAAACSEQELGTATIAKRLGGGVLVDESKTTFRGHCHVKRSDFNRLFSVACRNANQLLQPRRQPRVSCVVFVPHLRTLITVLSG